MKIQKTNSSEISNRNLNKLKCLEDIGAHSEGIIFAKGVFDLLHEGHINLFSYIESIKEARLLVVGVASDRITKIKKGPDRPINDEKHRLNQVAAFPVVDCVILNDDMDYTRFIKKLSPAVYIKGMDTALKEGGENELIDNNPELSYMADESLFIIFCDDGKLSTTETIKRIKANN